MANPAYVQGTKVSNGSGSTTSVPITLSVTNAGDSLQLNIGCYRASTVPIISSVTDGKGNTWNPVNPGYGGANRSWGQAWAALNVASGSTTVTVTFAATVQYVYLELHELSNAQFVGCSNGEASTSSGTALTTPTLSMPGANELFLQFGFVHAASAVITPGSGYTAAQNGGTSPMLMASGYQLIPTQGNSGASMTSSVSGDWVCFASAWSNALGTPAKGEVVLSGTQIGTPGSHGSGMNTLTQLVDANAWTPWDTPDTTGIDWAGVDCGAPIQATRILFSLYPGIGASNIIAGGQFQASNDATWANFTSLHTFSGFDPTYVYGTLLNTFTVPAAGNYRYYRYLMPNGNYQTIADLEFYGNYYSGVVATASPVTFSPPGGFFDLPTPVAMASSTTDAVIYYTTDGSTPTTSSNLYSGQIVIGSNQVLKAIAVSSGIANSRVTKASLHINSVAPGDALYAVNRKGYPFFAIAGSITQDPVSGLWYWYGWNQDQPGVGGSPFSSTFFQGIDCYSSPDLRNWTFQGTVVGSATVQYRMHMLYNASNSTYVLWTDQAYTAGLRAYTSNSPTGPFTLAGGPYTTINGIGCQGDFSLFQDTDGSAYLICNCDGPDQSQICKLNAAYTNIDGVNSVTYTNDTTSPFGQRSEGYAMVKVGSVYFWMASGYNIWAPNQNRYVTGSSPLGPWSASQNPFQPTTDPNALGLNIGGYAQNQIHNYAYDSQTGGLILIPGRNGGVGGLVYYGDRWDVPNPALGTDTTGSFINWRPIFLPVTVSGSTLTINWSSSWQFDAAMPPSTGMPSAPSALVVS